MENEELSNEPPREGRGGGPRSATEDKDDPTHSQICRNAVRVLDKAGESEDEATRKLTTTTSGNGNVPSSDGRGVSLRRVHATSSKYRANYTASVDDLLGQVRARMQLQEEHELQEKEKGGSGPLGDETETETGEALVFVKEDRAKKFQMAEKLSNVTEGDDDDDKDDYDFDSDEDEDGAGQGSEGDETKEGSDRSGYISLGDRNDNDHDDGDKSQPRAATEPGSSSSSSSHAEAKKEANEGEANEQSQAAAKSSGSSGQQKKSQVEDETKANEGDEQEQSRAAAAANPNPLIKKEQEEDTHEVDKHSSQADVARANNGQEARPNEETNEEESGVVNGTSVSSDIDEESLAAGGKKKETATSSQAKDKKDKEDHNKGISHFTVSVDQEQYIGTGKRKAVKKTLKGWVQHTKDAVEDTKRGLHDWNEATGGTFSPLGKAHKREVR